MHSLPPSGYTFSAEVEVRAMWFLGMDVGTGGTRAVIVEKQGS